jgi:predicted DNA-binding protein (MmcQ/YjbR family)
VREASKVNYQQVKKYLLSKPEAIEDYPFGPVVEVFKVKNKMFATLILQEGRARMNLKCDPEEAQALRDIFEAVVPAYHMNKTHWNTIILDGSVPAFEIERMIDRSYGLVVKGLKKSLRESLELIYGHDQLYQ